MELSHLLYRLIKQQLLCCIFLFAMIGFAKADQLTDAIQALDKGDYKKAAILGKLLIEKGDYKKLAVLTESMAERGDVSAQALTGLMYEQGQGVQKDISEAIRWYSLAAKQGSSLAQTQLGKLYLNGESVPQNYKVAVNYFLLAAEQAYPSGIIGLGSAYFMGWGVPTDLVRSYMWFNLAMMFSSQAEKNGLDQDDIKMMRKLREGLVAVMSRDQIDEAQELSLKCLNNSFKNC